MLLTDILLGTMTVVGMASGISALVFYRKANANGKAPPPAPVIAPPEPPVFHVRPREPVVIAGLEELPAKIERGLAPVFEGVVARMANLVQEASAPPAWVSEITGDLVESGKRLEHIATELAEFAVAQAVPPAWPGEIRAGLEEITGRLETLLQVQPAPSAETAQLERITNQLDEILRKRANPPPVIPRSERMPSAGPGGAGVGGGDPASFVAPPPQRAEDITLGMFNTLTLLANEVYTLIPPESGIYQINLANMGPGNLYIRADADPAPGDPLSELLPRGAFDNEIHFPDTLRILTDVDDTVVLARLAYS